MNAFPVLVAVLGWLTLGLETGVKDDLSIWVGSVKAAPSFAVPLAVFIAICAAPTQALWTALLLGLGMDLLSPVVSSAGNNLVVLGPHALGMVVAAQFVLLTRGLVIRRNPLTMVALSIPAALMMHIVVVAIFRIRQFYSPLDNWFTLDELGARFLGSLLTGGTALVMSILLLPLAPALGLPPAHGRRR